MSSEEEKSTSLTRVQRRQQQTRANLIRAALKLVGEHGVEAMTIRDIANEADVAMGSFYNYFSSKEELVDEAVRGILYDCGETVDKLNAGKTDPLDIIATAFATFAEMTRVDPLLGWFLVNMSSHDATIGATLSERFTRDVRHGIESGRFKVPNASIAIGAAQSALIDFLRQRLLGTVSDEEIVDFIHLILRLLGAPETAARKAANSAYNAAGLQFKETV